MGKKISITPLKLARMQSGFRQFELARMIGCSIPAYSLRENGHAPISPGDAKKLAKILKTPVSELFPGDGK